LPDRIRQCRRFHLDVSRVSMEEKSVKDTRPNFQVM
jgi:hypothetical protein